MKKLLQHLQTHPYIVNKTYDWWFFLLAPILATIIGGNLFSAFESVNFTAGTYALVAFGTFITNFHLVLVFYRSHNNRQIFKEHFWRFTLFPITLLILFFYSEQMFYLGMTLALFWDSYHSAMQVFGIGRIYDAKLGNDARKGRTMDFILNLVIHYGPMILGLTSEKNLKTLLYADSAFSLIKSPMLEAIYPYIAMVRPFVGLGMLSFILYYVYYCAKIQKAGYKSSHYKLWLYALTFLCRWYIFSFHFTSAWIVLNTFHALQYFGIVWSVEKDRIVKLFGGGAKIAMTFFLTLASFYALYISGSSSLTAIKISLTVTLLHYWYDGFIWSVRKKQV